MRSFAFVVCVLGCGSVAVGCGDSGETGTLPDVPVTTSYYRDVKPILDQHCNGCHQPGQIGVGVFDDYTKASALAGIIRQEVESRVMPPWPAAAGCNEYNHDASLTDAQIAAIVTWAEEGAPAGDPADDPEVKVLDPPVLSRIDHELVLAEAYSPVSGVADDYRCFIVDWPETETTFVTGFGVRVDNASTVHHLIAYIAQPADVADFEALDAADEGAGYTCFGGPGGSNSVGTAFFGAWAPGVLDADMPAGTGIRIEPGSKVIMQMHYNAVSWDGVPDQSAIVVKVEDQVDKEGKFEFFTDPDWVFGGGMGIAAGAPDVVHETAMDASVWMSGGKPFTIYGGGLHMHTRGTQIRLGLQRQAGAEECLIDMQRWDFDWQFGYSFAKPVLYQPGDKLTLGCHWDNSPSNQPSVGGEPMPPQDLAWGDGTNDEMCLATVYVTVD